MTETRQPTRREEIRAKVLRAREAVGRFRDAVRAGTVIDFRQRDPLVMAIHEALDEIEPLLKLRDAADLLREEGEAPAHAVYCNASRKHPVGNPGCSCPIGRRIKAQEPTTE